MKYLSAGAELSEDGVYRYALWRRLGMGERSVFFVGLNPSTADASADDPTIRRCVGFAQAWGFDWFYMGNLLAYRSTDPRALPTGIESVGPKNWETLARMSQRAETVIAAWGANRLPVTAQDYARRILALPRTRVLGWTKSGAPKHPLYLPKSVVLLPAASAPQET